MASHDPITPTDDAPEAARLLLGVVDRLAEDVCDRSPEQADCVGAYIPRLLECLNYHTARKPGSAAESFQVLIEMAERGELIPGDDNQNLLLDVMTAQAMELKHERAIRRFERHYLPSLLAFARHRGGDAAAMEFENFAAELILPRAERPPRIRQYRGRTTLKHWLRAVAANLLVSLARKKRPQTLADAGANAAAEQIPAAERECESLLRPLFAQVSASIDAEQRLLLKLLLVDDVPQQQVARVLGIASGNVTRRRQKAVAEVVRSLGRLAAERSKERHVAECLESVLAGEDRHASERLGVILAAGLAGSRNEPGEEAR